MDINFKKPVGIPCEICFEKDCGDGIVGFSLPNFAETKKFGKNLCKKCADKLDRIEKWGDIEIYHKG